MKVFLALIISALAFGCLSEKVEEIDLDTGKLSIKELEPDEIKTATVATITDNSTTQEKNTWVEEKPEVFHSVQSRPMLNNLPANFSQHLDVFLCPHTHVDPGWLKTFNQYYSGANNSIYHASVESILDEVIVHMYFEPSRKFIFGEVSLFERWYNNIKNPRIKDLAREYLKNGRYEFVAGGWVSHDEAVCYYEDMIDNMDIGLRWLNDTLQIIPRISWQLDPFGHSLTHASFSAQMGYDAVYFARIDYQDHLQRVNKSALEFVWIPETSQGAENFVLGVVTFFHYSAPKGFCFDVLCYDKGDTIRDDVGYDDYNVDKRAKEFADYFRNMSTVYRTPNLFHTYGDDFHFQSASTNFKNAEKLMDYINSHYEEFNMTIKYSTVSDYIHKLSTASVSFPTKHDDFFPYADIPRAYWTGYYTSRVALKGLIRTTGIYLQNVRRALFALWNKNKLSKVYPDTGKLLSTLKELEKAMALSQHHDAITGTEKQHVADDYVSILLKAREKTQNMIVSKLFSYFADDVDHKFELCSYNVSSEFCHVTRDLSVETPVIVALFSAINKNESVIRLKVSRNDIIVLNEEGLRITSDIICANSTNTTDCDLFFADALVENSFRYYLLKVDAGQSNELTAVQMQYNASQEEDKIDIGSTFQLKNVAVSKNLSCFEFNGGAQDFCLEYRYYPSANAVGVPRSGMYLFRPNRTLAPNGSLPYDKPNEIKVYAGSVLTQIHIIGNKTQTSIRIYGAASPAIEIETFIDSIEMEGTVGKEVVMTVSSSKIANNRTFYTDSNGMEMQKRVLNYRPTWDLNVTEPISGNYYPITSSIYITDGNSSKSMALFTDRAVGGSSLAEGTIELMLHRRIGMDDHRGVAEALNETDWDGKGLRQRVRTWLLLSSDNTTFARQHRRMQLERDQEPLIGLAAAKENPKLHRMTDLVIGSDSLLKKLVTIVSDEQVIIRLHNLNDAQSLEVETRELTGMSGAVRIEELALGGNMLKKEMISRKIRWNGMELPPLNEDYLVGKILLRPLEIRTFRITRHKTGSSDEL